MCHAWKTGLLMVTPTSCQTCIALGSERSFIHLPLEQGNCGYSFLGRHWKTDGKWLHWVSCSTKYMQNNKKPYHIGSSNSILFFSFIMSFSRTLESTHTTKQYTAELHHRYLQVKETRKQECFLKEDVFLFRWHSKRFPCSSRIGNFIP